MIRQATIDDLYNIVAIYNQAIAAGFQTGYTERWKPEDRMAWLQAHLGEDYPLWVYCMDGMVAGWCSISPYRQGRDAFRHTVEISYFIDIKYQGKGTGRQLVSFGIEACRGIGYKTALAIILDKNKASIALIEKAGFEKWGTMPGVADFNGSECSHLYYGIKLYR